MCLPQRACQYIGLPWDGDQVDMVRHQAVADQFHAMSLNALLEQIEVNPAFRVSLQNEAPRIPALGDVVSNV